MFLVLLRNEAVFRCLYFLLVFQVLHVSSVSSVSLKRANMRAEGASLQSVIYSDSLDKQNKSDA